MRKFKYKGLLKASLLASAVLIASPYANAQLSTTIDGNNGKLPTPPGLFVTPTAPLTSAIQQPLNPGLANYPNFVAGEAVKVVLSPDGKTLAILTAGKNSLYNASGVVDTAASTQFIFLYDVAGANKTSPVLKQVIQQLNSHVGLVWAPNSQTLYAAGGCDDAVYAYTNSGSGFLQSAKISMGHAANGCASSRCAIGLGVAPNVAGLAITADGKTLVAANNYNDSISVIDTASANSPL